VLMKCILRLKETYDLQTVLTKMANQAYDSNNQEHEDKLMKVCKKNIYTFFLFIYLFI